MPAKKKVQKSENDKDKLGHLMGVLRKWKHTVFFSGKDAYIAHHVDKKKLKIFNKEHIHKIKLVK